MGLLEYTFSPHWFFAFVDQYNGGYTSDGKTYEVYITSTSVVASSKGTNCFELGYGKVREGIFWVVSAAMYHHPMDLLLI